MQIRPVTMADFNAITKINQNALNYQDNPQIVLERLKAILLQPKQYYFIGAANDENVIVGYLHAEVYQSLYMDTQYGYPI